VNWEEVNKEERVNNFEVCLNDILSTPPQVDLFFTTLLINNKLLRNCMIDSGSAINIMPIGVMKQLGMCVDIIGGKCYAMDN
jgi:uncharacterized membrane protein SpoIIM required for sporulation